MQVGGGIALTTGIETAGVGALAGGVLSLYGAGSAGVATADMAKILKQLYQLNMSANGESDAGSRNEETNSGNYKEVKGNKAANDVAKEHGYRDAHDLKESHVGSKDSPKFDIYKDSKTGKLRLYNKSKKIGIDVYSR